MRALVLLLCLAAVPVHAARFRGILDSTGRLALRARLNTGGVWKGTWRCHGRVCPIHRGQANWSCGWAGYEGVNIGAVGGGQGGLNWVGICTDGDGVMMGQWFGEDVAGQGLIDFWRVR